MEFESEFQIPSPAKSKFSNRQNDNPQNRFENLEVEYEQGVERPQEMRLKKEVAKTILTRNDSPDLPFQFSVNPYRGCAHACAYCYARPFHEYLGLGAGTDFDTQIIAKLNAATILNRELNHSKWQGEPIAFSGITDCYQPAEHALKITRACLEVCATVAAPVGIITKSNLIRRDLDILTDLKNQSGCHVVISIPVFETELSQALEPFASTPEARFRCIESLAKSGLKVGVSLGPVIPGLTDSDIPKILEKAAGAGAVFAFYTMLRLPGSVKTVFMERLKAVRPQQVGKVDHHLRSLRGGQLYNSDFGSRMRGEGPFADLIENFFRVHAIKHGLAVGESWMALSPRTIMPAKRKAISGREPGSKTLVQSAQDNSGIQQSLFGN